MALNMCEFSENRHKKAVHSLITFKSYNEIDWYFESKERRG
jgi:hypothetical protein